MIAAVVILAAMCSSGQALHDLVEPLRRYRASGELNTTVADTDRVIEHVAGLYSDYEQDRLDGLTVDCGDWWFSLRASNTEPLLRLNLEAADEEAVSARVAEVQSHMASTPAVA